MREVLARDPADLILLDINLPSAAAMVRLPTMPMHPAAVNNFSDFIHSSQISGPTPMATKTHFVSYNANK